MNELVKKVLRLLPDKIYISLKYFYHLKKLPDLKNPKTFTEKLQWLKLHDRKPIYTELVDKYEVRKHIATAIGEEYLIPLVGGPWDNFDEIDFDKLPEQFVLKCTHDSGGLVICRDKSKLDIRAAKEKINRCLKNNYYYHGREWPYKNIKPRIIAEKYLEDTQGEALQDLKFFCFDGVPKIMYISRDKADDPRTDFFDMEFNHLNIRMRDKNANILPERPTGFEEMQLLAAILSRGIPHLRVDLYFVDRRIYVGEMTFFHCSGFVLISPKEWEDRLGDWIKLPVN